MKTHFANHHTNNVRSICKICLKTFINSTILAQHTKRIHSSETRIRLPCQFSGCDKTYLNKPSINLHVKMEHTDNPERFTCTLCGKEFKQNANLCKHIVVHTKEKSYKCSICVKSFGEKAHLKKHQVIFVMTYLNTKFINMLYVHNFQVQHMEKSVRPVFTCHSCPRVYFTKCGLKSYIRTIHEKQKNYQCIICAKKYGLAHHLKVHAEAVHPSSGAAVHSCKKCGYKCFSKQYLAQHIRIHEIGGKKHERYFCGSKFIRFSHLVEHVSRMHTLEAHRSFLMRPE